MVLLLLSCLICCISLTFYTKNSRHWALRDLYVIQLVLYISNCFYVKLLRGLVPPHDFIICSLPHFLFLCLRFFCNLFHFDQPISHCSNYASPSSNFSPYPVVLAYIYYSQGSYKKLNLKFKNIFGGKTNLFKNISGASSAHFIYNTINRAISSRETKSLTEVGAVKNVNNGYYRKNRHSVFLRGMLFNQEMNVQR